MKIILTKDIEKVGNQGDIKNVADGFFRNFLLPKKLAIPATETNLKIWELKRKQILEKRQRELQKLKEVAKILESTTVSFKIKSKMEGKVFGSITREDLIKKIQQEKDILLDKSNLSNYNPLKEEGVVKVEVVLDPDIKTFFTVKLEK